MEGIGFEKAQATQHCCDVYSEVFTQICMTIVSIDKRMEFQIHAFCSLPPSPFLFRSWSSLCQRMSYIPQIFRALPTPAILLIRNLINGVETQCPPLLNSSPLLSILHLAL